MAKKSVLLVDDAALFRRAAALVVGEMLPEVELHSAANGALALAVLETHRVDLLVTDLAMPTLGGTGLLAGVLRRGRPLPVIVLTATTTPDFVAWAKRTNAVGILSKPVVFPALGEAIRRELAGGEPGIAPFTLEVLCRLLSLELASVELRVVAPNARGALHFLHGVLRHAETPTETGVPAAIALLSGAEAFPEIRPLALGVPVTIVEPLEDVLSMVSRGRGRVATSRPPRAPNH